MSEIIDYLIHITKQNQDLVTFIGLMVGVFLTGVGFVPGLRSVLGRREVETKQELDLQRALLESEQKLAAQDTEIVSLRDSNSTQAEQLNAIQQVLNSERQAQHSLASAEQALWNERDPIRPEGYPRSLTTARTRIITVANLKGGVGKTTLTANLAAYLARAKGKRVLLIDTDFQRSLSNLLQNAVQDPGVSLRLADWLNDETPPTQLVQAACRLHPFLPNSAMVTSSYELAPFEQLLMARWWFTDEYKGDARYALVQNLLSEAVQSKFDIILIDAPPRLSISAINALSASTHLLIPTTLDALSTDAVATFLQMIQTLRSSLLPGLELAGIIPMMTSQQTLTKAENGQIEKLRRDLLEVKLPSPPYVFSRNIPRWKAFTQGVAYCSDDRAKGILDEAGAELCRRIGVIDDEGPRVLARAPLPRAPAGGVRRTQRRN